MEAETPVNQRALRRALSPPLTLLKFFKPRADETSAGGSGEGGAKESAGHVPSPSAADCSRGPPPPTLAVCSSSQSEGKVHSTGGSVAMAARGCSKQVKLADAFSRVGSSPQPTSRERPIVIADDTRGENAGKSGARSVGVRGRRKRKLEQEVGVAPIKQALERRASRDVIRCPVCQQEFAVMKNLDLNAHLDACLRNPPPPV